MTRDFQKSVYMRFNDSSKAFVCVNHQALLNCLQKMGIPEHIYFCYADGHRTGDNNKEIPIGYVWNTDWFKVNKGVR